MKKIALASLLSFIIFSGSSFNSLYSNAQAAESSKAEEKSGAKKDEKSGDVSKKDAHGKVKEIKTNFDTMYPVKIPTFEGRHLQEGNKFYARGMYREAYGEYFMSVRLNPSFWQGFRAIGYVYLKQGKPKTAINNYLKAISIINPTYASKTLDEGKVALKEGDIYLAIAKFQKILNIPPEAGVLVDEGVQLLKENKKSAAEKKFNEAVKVDLAYDKTRPDGAYADVHFKLGSFDYDKKKYPEAIKEFEWAVKLDPSEFGYHYGLGNAYYKLAFKNKKKPDQSMLDKAVKSYEKAYAFDPRDIDVMYNLAAAKVDNAGLIKTKVQEKVDEVNKIYDEISKKNEKPKGKTKVEPVKFNMQEKLDTDKKIFMLNAEGEKYNVKAVKEAEEAVRLLEKVTNANPQDAQAFSYLGDAYAMVGKKPDDFINAVDSYKKAIELDNTMTDLYAKMGTAYYLASNLTPNAEDLPITRENSKLYVKFGKKYYRAEMLISARDSFNSFLVYGKPNANARAYLATVNKDIDNLGFRVPDKNTGR